MGDYLVANFAQAIPMAFLGYVCAYISRKHNFLPILFGTVLGALPAFLGYLLIGTRADQIFFTGIVGGVFGFVSRAFFVQKSNDAQARENDFRAPSTATTERLTSFSRQEENQPNTRKEKTTSNVISDEFLYEQVALEIEQNKKLKGLWTKLWTEADGDEKKATIRYIKARVQQMKQELEQQLVTENEGETVSENVPDFSQNLASTPPLDSLEAAEAAYALAEAAELKNPFREFGLSLTDVAYLKSPVRALDYLFKHKTTQEKLEAAIAKGKLRAMWIEKELWVENKKL
jgi:hypothetical protein